MVEACMWGADSQRSLQGMVPPSGTSGMERSSVLTDGIVSSNADDEHCGGPVSRYESGDHPEDLSAPQARTARPAHTRTRPPTLRESRDCHGGVSAPPACTGAASCGGACVRTAARTRTTASGGGCPAACAAAA